jgi:hypothetical protein
VRIAEATTGSEIVARVTVTVRAGAFGGLTVSRTSVPGGPLMSAIAVLEGSLWSERPLTATIRSPTFSPARLAGVESNTRAISRPVGLGATETPIPAKLAGWSKLLNSRGER